MPLAIARNVDGQVIIEHPTPQFIKKYKNEKEAIKALIEKRGDGTIINIDDIPKDRAFRNAWEISGKKCIVNINKAKEIHIDKLRNIRNEKLKELDVQYIIADEEEDTKKKKEIKDLKKKLRDMPTDALLELQQETDIEVIKTYIPNCMKD